MAVLGIILEKILLALIGAGILFYLGKYFAVEERSYLRSLYVTGPVFLLMLVLELILIWWGSVIKYIFILLLPFVLGIYMVWRLNKTLSLIRSILLWLSVMVLTPLVSSLLGIIFAIIAGFR